MASLRSIVAQSWIWRFLRSHWLEGLGVAVFLIATIDIVVYSGSVFVEGLLQWLSNNQNVASILISALLLYAYFLQFRSQEQQRKLMEQQKWIMDAGYTPIIGVTNQKIEDDSPRNSSVEKEKIVLKITNRGNSLATNLQLRFLISYDVQNPQFASAEIPLRRTKDGTWWHEGDGAAISNEEQTEFFAPAQVTDTITGYSIPISQAIDEIFHSNDDVETIQVATELRYQDAMNDQHSIGLSAYTIKESGEGRSMKLSNAVKRAVDDSDKGEEILQKITEGAEI